MTLDALKDWIVLFGVVALTVIHWIYSVKGAPSLQAQIARLAERLQEIERLLELAEERGSERHGATTTKVGTLQLDMAVMMSQHLEDVARANRLESRVESLWKVLSQRMPIREENT